MSMICRRRKRHGGATCLQKRETDCCSLCLARRKANTPRISTQPKEPIECADLGKTPEGWKELHEWLHSFEGCFNELSLERKDAFVKAMAIFLGGATAEANNKHFALNSVQSLVRLGFVDYDGQRNTVCQAVVTAHRAEHDDQTVN